MTANACDDVPSAGTQSAARVADMLLLFGFEQGPLGVTEISRRLGFSKASVHRMLQSLVSRQLLAMDRSRRVYMLGPATAALGARALQHLDLRMIAQPVLRDLQAETEETTTVSALVGSSRVYLDEVVSLQQIRMTVELGAAFPLHAGSSGKAILAFVAPEFRERVLQGPLARLTADTRVDPDVMRAELEVIALEGVAISRGERDPGAASIAAPIFGLDGTVTGAVSVCGPVYRFDDEAVARFAPAVRTAGGRISDLLARRMSEVSDSRTRARQTKRETHHRAPAPT